MRCNGKEFRGIRGSAPSYIWCAHCQDGLQKGLLDQYDRKYGRWAQGRKMKDAGIGRCEGLNHDLYDPEARSCRTQRYDEPFCLFPAM